MQTESSQTWQKGGGRWIAKRAKKVHKNAILHKSSSRHYCTQGSSKGVESRLWYAYTTVVRGHQPLIGWPFQESLSQAYPEREREEEAGVL